MSDRRFNPYVFWLCILIIVLALAVVSTGQCQERCFIPGDAPPAAPEVLSKTCPHCSRDWLRLEKVGVKSHPELDEDTQRFITVMRRELVALQEEVRRLRHENEVMRFDLNGGDQQTGHYYDPRNGTHVWTPSAPLAPTKSK